MENSIISKLKSGCYIDFFNVYIDEIILQDYIKITNDKNGENVPHLKLTQEIRNKNSQKIFDRAKSIMQMHLELLEKDQFKKQ